jgi:L-threonylcarbamoyladenylate synthase
MILAAGSADLSSRLLDLLSTGGIAIIPCDTMYGIVGAAPETEVRIRAVKGRGDDKPFLQLIPDASWVGKMTGANVPPSLLSYWPGPLTVIMPSREEGTVGVRVPDSPFLRQLILSLGKPIYSTSVNRTGNPPLSRIEEIRVGFEADVGLIVDAGDFPESAPSTIIDATTRPYRIIRQGALQIRPGDLG